MQKEKVTSGEERKDAEGNKHPLEKETPCWKINIHGENETSREEQNQTEENKKRLKCPCTSLEIRGKHMVKTKVTQ